MNLFILNLISHFKMSSKDNKNIDPNEHFHSRKIQKFIFSILSLNESTGAVLCIGIQSKAIY